MRATVVYTLAAILAAVTGLAAEDKKDAKIDAKKLVGKWESKEFKEKGVSKVIEFTKDGKVVETSTNPNGGETKLEGTYAVDGAKLTVTVKLNGKERKVAATISKLTDAEMTSADEGGFGGTWVRVKDK